MIKKIIKIILLLFCMFLIFSFSSDNGVESSKKSDGSIIRVYEYITKKKLPKVGFVTYDSDANEFDYIILLE